MDLDDALSSELQQIEATGLLRHLSDLESPQGVRIEVDGRSYLNFSSNDYLGLSNHPALVEAGKEALDRFGAGAGASRLICGSLPPHRELETAFADFKQTEAAALFSTGYSAAVGCIDALLGKTDVIILDKLVHASIIDAAKLSGAKLRVFRHNDLNDLESKLKWASDKYPRGRKLIVTESVFSMDGDLAPLLNIADLKDQYGAWLMVDEAHATGLFGERRSGLCEEFGLTGRVEIQMATLGKALGSSGGVICGSRNLIDLLINRARSFIYSTAPPPAEAACTLAALDIVRSAEGERKRQHLWAMVENLKTMLLGTGLPPGLVRAPIIPAILGDESAAVAKSEELKNRGIFVPAIRFPTVARGSARLRFTITADHTLDDLAELQNALTADANVPQDA